MIQEGKDPKPPTSTHVFPCFRFLRQLSEPCLSFLPPEKTANTPYQSSSHDRRPVYQRHLSEPLVPHGPRALKQELVDPRYPDPGLPAPGLAQPPPTFSHVTIKQEPRDFSFDSGLLRLLTEFSGGWTEKTFQFASDNLRCVLQGSTPASHQHSGSLRSCTRTTTLVSCALSSWHRGLFSGEQMLTFLTTYNLYRV